MLYCLLELQLREKELLAQDLAIERMSNLLEKILLDLQVRGLEKRLSWAARDGAMGFWSVLQVSPGIW